MRVASRCVVAPAPARAPTGAAPPSCSSTIRRRASSPRRRGSTTSSASRASPDRWGRRRCGARSAPPSASSATPACVFVQYKLCSTFNSSRSVGNLGVVVELAREIFPDCFLPVFAAMPEFGRYTVFGQHFARFGDAIFRLDRHPSMSRHPTTPMNEADLGRILEDQGAPPCGLVDLRALAGGSAAVAQAIAGERARVPGPIVFDGLTGDDCALVAEAVWRAAEAEPTVVLSAQGFAYGFGRFRMRRMAEGPQAEPLSRVKPVCRLNTPLRHLL